MEGPILITIIISVYYICGTVERVAAMKYANQKRKDD